MNTIHRYIDWNPTYYVAVDHRVYREFGKDIERKYKFIPKFILAGKLDEWRGENFIRFLQSTRDEFDLNNLESGIAMKNVMQAAMQLAFYMGFTTMLIIGMHHRPEAGKLHFWGMDEGMRNPAPLVEWFEGYRILVREMAARGVQVLNISEGTHVPEDVIPRDDWRKYDNKSQVLARLSRESN